MTLEKPKRKQSPRQITPLVYLLIGMLVGSAVMASIAYFGAGIESPPNVVTSVTGRDGESLPVLDIAISPDGTLLAVAIEEKDGTASIYLRELDKKGGLLPDVRPLLDHIAPVGNIEFTADGKRLIAAPHGHPNHHTVLSININDGTFWEFGGSYAGASGEVMTIVSGDSRTHYHAYTGQLIFHTNLEGVEFGPVAVNQQGISAMMTRHADGEAEVLFSSDIYPPEDFLSEDEFRDMIWSPQGDRIIAAVKSGLLLHNVQLDGATYGTVDYGIGTLNRLAVINDWLAVAGDGAVQLLHYETRPGWTTLQWMKKEVLEGHSVAVTGLAFLPDGRHLLTASADGTVRLWQFVEGILLWEMPA